MNGEMEALRLWHRRLQEGSPQIVDAHLLSWPIALLVFALLHTPAAPSDLRLLVEVIRLRIHVRQVRPRYEGWVFVGQSPLCAFARS